MKRVELYLSILAAVGAWSAVAKSFFLTPYRLDVIELHQRDTEKNTKIEFDAVRELILDDRKKNEAAREGLIRIEEQTRAIRDRVDEMLRKSRNGASVADPGAMAKVGIAPAVRVENLFVPEPTDKNIALTNSCP
jgi:hypothetical protein